MAGDIQVKPDDVRFGSEADIETRIGRVRFTPESGHPSLRDQRLPIVFGDLSKQVPQDTFKFAFHLDKSEQAIQCCLDRDAIQVHVAEAASMVANSKSTESILPKATMSSINAVA